MNAYLRTPSSVIVAMLLISVSLTLHAEEITGTETNVLGQTIDTSTPSVSYLNGGVGVEESDAIRLRAPEFPVHISFSKGKYGESITDVDLNITNRDGFSVFESNSAGPLLYLKLPNGLYTISSKYGDVKLTSKIKVSAKKQVNLYLNWKASIDDASSELNQSFKVLPSETIPEEPANTSR
jgi:hypothetical protein